MPVLQRVDGERNLYKNTAFKGNGFSNKLPKAFYQGGFIDFPSTGNLINENKDLIKSGINTIDQIADFGKAVKDTVKTSKELEKLERINEIKSKKKSSNYSFTPEQEERFKSFAGNGFKII
jgi:hypothetical protein